MKIKNNSKTIEILLIEDNLGDNRLMVEVFKEGEIRNNMHMVTNGVEAMEFLHRENKHSDCSASGSYITRSELTKKRW